VSGCCSSWSLARAVQSRHIAQGNIFGMVGMADRDRHTLAGHPPAGMDWHGCWVVLGIAIGGSIGAVIARRVR